QITDVWNICYGYLINTKHNTMSKWHGFMPWYKLSRRDCATVTHLYKLSPNTEPRHAMRTIRNIVKAHRSALVHHIEEDMRPPHGIMGRLFRHVTIFYCSLPESVHQHNADITIYFNAR